MGGRGGLLCNWLLINLLAFVCDFCFFSAPGVQHGLVVYIVVLGGVSAHREMNLNIVLDRLLVLCIVL